MKPNKTTLKFMYGTAVSGITLALSSSHLAAQSARAYEVANCNASFKGCSGGGSGAPIGDLGGSGLELIALALIAGAIAYKPLKQSLFGQG